MKDNSDNLQEKGSKSKKALAVFKDYGLMVLGSFLFALSVDMFNAPNNIVAGGVTGISTILNYLFGLPIGIMSILINIPLFVWGAVENGKRFLVKTIFATLVSSALIDVLVPFIPAYTGDKLMASLFGAITLGLGLGLIFHGGGTTGGTDIISKNLRNHFPFLTMGTIIIIADIVVIAATLATYKSIESALYSIIFIGISSKVIDFTLYGLSHDNGQVVYIMSAQYDEISRAIMNEIKRGVTLLDSQGAYTGKETKTIMCAVRPQQVYKVKNIASSIDKSAFIVVTKANIIDGEGFKNNK